MKASILVVGGSMRAVPRLGFDFEFALKLKKITENLRVAELCGKLV
jgi:hypothetical protein